MAKRSSKLGGRSRTIIPDYIVNQWEGLNTYIKDFKDLGDGQSPDSLNWLTSKYKDHIELRGGYALVGKTRNSGTGRVTGLGVGTKADGTQVPYFSYLQKIKYYDSVANDTVEVSTTNVLPSAASGEDVSFMPYQNLAGTFMYATSKNSSIYKTHIANPATITDLKSTSFRGIAKIGQNRMFMWQRQDTYNQKYVNTLYVGVSDKATITQYTQVTTESAGIGNGSTKAFSGTQAFKASNSKATSFYTEFAAPIANGVAVTGISAASQAVVTVASHSLNVGDAVLINGVSGMTQINNIIGIVTATTTTTITLSINSSSFTAYSSGGTIYKAEYFIDDGNGNLTSSLGGTGTINYSSGAYTLNFNTAPLNSQNIYTQYYTEDATNGGVADFTIDGSTQGKGKTFQQADGGGDIQGVYPFDQVEYCFHILKSWYLSMTTNDTQASNLPYRSNLGIPYFRGAYPTDDGIVFIDCSHPATPKVKILTIDNNSATAVITVVPNSISESLDLSTYGFSQAVVFRWGDYDILACQASLNGVVQNINTQFFVRNIYTQQWDRCDYAVSCLAEYMGTLISGDSLSNNIFTLFSGFDDDGNLINNYWTSKYYDLGVEGIKKTNRFVIRGLIQQTQNIDIYFSYDSGSLIKLCTVRGTGSYVNLGQPITVGSSTVGSNVIGGGGNTTTAYPFEVEFTISSDIYEYVQVVFAANNIGFAQIDEFAFKDNRYKGKHITPTRTVVY